MSMFDAMVGAYRSSQYRPSSAAVPSEDRAFDPRGNFSLGLPWPWYVDPEGDRPSSSLSGLEILAPRTSGLAIIRIQSLGQQTTIDESDVNRSSRAFAKGVAGSPLKPERLLVGGMAALLFQATTTDTHHCHLVLPNESETIEIDASFPAASAAGYMQHFRTMLADWYWH